MDAIRFALVGAALAVIATLAGVAWLITHQGYPDTVYYERLSVSTAMLPSYHQSAELWVDPARNLALRTTTTGFGRTSSYIQPGGHTAVVDATGSYAGDSLSDDEWRAFMADNSALARGGFLGLATSRLAHANGPIRRVMLNGRPALRFETAQHSDTVERLVVWIDALTHEPLQLQVSYPEYTFTQTVLQMRRLPAGSLPPDFFDPPRRHGTLWDSALSWVRDHLIPSR
jgi:hypothetical protein